MLPSCHDLTPANNQNKNSHSLIHSRILHLQVVERIKREKIMNSDKKNLIKQQHNSNILIYRKYKINYTQCNLS